MAETKCAYQSSIRGDYLKVFRTYFPLSEMLSPPEGWSLLRVSLWRKGCADECWRLLFVRTASLSPSPSR